MKIKIRKMIKAKAKTQRKRKMLGNHKIQKMTFQN